MRPFRRARPFLRRLRLLLALVALLLVALLASGWWLMRGSLATLDGTQALARLSAPVAVQRDALGVVTVEARDRLDAARALGFVHAQERYFEMDLMRRSAAGELSELFGPRALEVDKRNRVHRMRARLAANLDAVLGEERPLLDAYVEGVNAGLATLRNKPWPYLLLRKQPARWTAVDSALVAQAMYFDLQDGQNAREYALWQMRPHLPPALYALLTHDGSSWDAPIAGRSHGDAQLPDTATVDLRRLPDAALAVQLPQPMEVGSNNFAVSGALTADGRALVADDMHLSLRAPNIWFRAQLRYADAQAPGGRVDVGGLTLPGLPVVIVGSNTHVAWGFTNSYGDYADWQLSPPCTGAAAACGITTTVERIRVAGQADEQFRVEETRWGPVLHRNPDGSRLALRWTAHLPGALNFGLAGFARAASLDDALRVADRTGVPHQNLVIGDRSGRIAWRLLGPVPARAADCTDVHGLRDALDVASASCAPWPLDHAPSPQITQAPGNRLWTANARVVDDAPLARLGDGGYVLGARAQQIRNDLFARNRFSERDLLAVQLDDRSVFLKRWWQLLRDTADRSRTPTMRALADASTRWTGRAATDDVAYRITRAWRLAVHERIANGLTAPARAALGKHFELPPLPQLEGVAWPLVTQRPMHLLPRHYASWDALFEDAARDVRDDLAKQGPLSERTWGERNTAAICHPLAGALPAFARPLLCMPAEPLSGDVNMPRVVGPNSGASERMVVSPGHERDGFIHMPGGQSGNPLSPYWGAGHQDWVHGRATPFLPGRTEHTLTLAPVAR